MCSLQLSNTQILYYIPRRGLSDNQTIPTSENEKHILLLYMLLEHSPIYICIYKMRTLSGNLFSSVKYKLNLAKLELNYKITYNHAIDENEYI